MSFISRIAKPSMVAATVAVIAAPAIAVGAGEGRPVDGGERNGTYTRETEIISSNGTYSTRQSNKGDGGSAIYGCRAQADAEPCVRANNLQTGRAFEFETGGKEVGRITSRDTTAAPFTTNASGTATGLSADRVDGIEGTDLAPKGDFKFAVVAASGGGQLVRGKGVQTVIPRADATNSIRVAFDRDVSACAYTASISGGSADWSLGVASVGGAPNQVQVDGRDDAQNQENLRGFQLQVTC